jgi:hypothetical protein
MRTTVALLLLLPAGCGLSDYEERMLDAQTRLDRFDKLDEPLTLPPVQGAPDVFFRPPLGVRGTAEEAPEGSFIYRYARRNPRAATPVTEVIVALTTGQPRFVAEVFKFFRTRPELVETQPREVAQEGQAPLAFDVSRYDAKVEGIAFETWVLRNAPADLQLAITFQIDKARLSDASALIDVSMGSLAFGTEAAKARATFARYKKTKPKQAPGG